MGPRDAPREPRGHAAPSTEGSTPTKAHRFGKWDFFPLVHPNPIAQSQLLCAGEIVSARDKDSS